MPSPAPKPFCLRGGGVFLPTQRDAAGKVTCASGFYCPLLDPANASTYPVSCQPSPACGMRRLLGAPCHAGGGFDINAGADGALDEPREPFEPRLCMQGFFCPAAQRQIECPTGYFCPPGAVSPVKCSATSICPAGTIRPTELAGLTLFILLAAVMCAAIVAYRRWGRQRLHAVGSLGAEDAPRRRLVASPSPFDAEPHTRSRSVSPRRFEDLGAVTSGQHSSPLAPPQAPSAGALANPAPEQAFDPVAAAAPVAPDHSPEEPRNSSAVRLDGAQSPIAFAPEFPRDPVAVAALCDAFGRARGGRPPITLEARDLRVTFPGAAATPAAGPLALLDNCIDSAAALFGKDAAHAPPEAAGGMVLLHGVSATMRPGRVTAIMGPSGAGKTVFMSALLGALDPSWPVNGSLHANGVPIIDQPRVASPTPPQAPRGNDSSAMHKPAATPAAIVASAEARQRLRPLVGFVPQDDVLHQELTVAANVFYSSELRLPSSWTSEERCRLRAAVLALLGLAAQADVTVGGGALSGAKLKLANVAVELAAAPPVLLLDEPTSGLDATGALMLVRLLADVARMANITVAMVIHQPREEIWGALQDLVVLAPGGRAVYQGPGRAEAQRYFSEIAGVPIAPLANPADVIMDAVAAEAARLVSQWACSTEKVNVEPTAGGPPPPSPGFAAKSDVTPRVGGDPLPHREPPPGLLRQLLLFFLRSVEKMAAAPSTVLVEAGISVACGLLLGFSSADFQLIGLYKDGYAVISPQGNSNMQAQLSMYAMMSLGLAASISGVHPFGCERQQYFHDAQVGCNRLGYFCGTAGAALLRVTVGSVGFTGAFFTMSRTPLPLWSTMWMYWLAYATFYGIAACVTFVVDNAGVNPLIAALLSNFISVFNGFIAFPLGVLRVSFTFYTANILQRESNEHIAIWTAAGLGDSGYAKTSPGASWALLTAWCILSYAVAFMFMVLLNREKQR